MNSYLDEKYIYRYKFRFVPLVWMGTFLPLTFLSSMTLMFRHHWHDAIMVFIIALCFILSIGWLLIMQVADILVDSSAIERRFYGAACQKLAWNQMVRLTIFPSKNPENGNSARSLIFVGSKDSSRFLSRRIMFQERKLGMKVLMAEITKNITLHQIPIVDLSRAGLNPQ